MSKKKVSYTIQLSENTHDEFEKIHFRTGMTKKAIIERLFVWFSQQNEVIQSEVLGLLPDSIRSDIAARILERMSNEKPDRKPVEAKQTR